VCVRVDAMQIKGRRNPTRLKINIASSLGRAVADRQPQNICSRTPRDMKITNDNKNGKRSVIYRRRICQTQRWEESALRARAARS